MRRGLTIPELLIAMGLFIIMLTSVHLVLNQGVRVWNRISGAEAASLQLKRAQRYLERDLLETSYTQTRVARVPGHLAGGQDGGALWFLSALGPDGKMAHKPGDGTAYYQRNVIYYLVVPGGHSDCAGLVGPKGMDDACPHKVLIRKVVDLPPATDPNQPPETHEEGLIPVSDIDLYLTQPNGRDLSAMQSEPGVTRVEVVANNLLWFDPVRMPDPDIANEIELDLRAVSLDDARREIKLGSVSLAEGRFTQQQLMSVIPKN